MATAAVTYPAFAAPNLADPNQLNQNFDDLVDFLNGDVLHRDGSKVAQAALNMGGFKLLNVATGTASTDAVNKGQMDAAIVAANPGIQGIAYFPTSSNQTVSSGTLTQLTGSDCSFTAVAGRRYKVSFNLSFILSVDADVWVISVRDSSDAVLWTTGLSAVGTSHSYAIHGEYVHTASISGSHTWDLAVQRTSGSGSFQTNGFASNAVRCLITVEDAGLL